MSKEAEEQLKKNLMVSAADMLEYSNETALGIACGAPEESTKLCIVAVLLPNEAVEGFMNSFYGEREAAMPEGTKIVSKRPDKQNFH